MRQIRDTDLGLEEYVQLCRNTAVYPGRDSFNGVNYTVLGLVGEAGEIANKLKKVIRDKKSILVGPDHLAIVDELGDVLWYVAMLSSELGIELSTVAHMNRAKLTKRALENKLHGSGDNR